MKTLHMSGAQSFIEMRIQSIQKEKDAIGFIVISSQL